MNGFSRVREKIGAGVVAILLAMSLVPTAVDAATVDVFDGDVINPIALDTTYTYEERITGSTGAVSRSITFVADAADAPLPLIASNLTLTGVSGTVVNPFMSWFDGTSTVTAVFDNITFGNTTIGVGAVLATLFEAPNALSQTLSFGWESFTGDAIQVSLQVSPVPLPAGGLLLLTALGGVTVLRRRRKAA